MKTIWRYFTDFHKEVKHPPALYIAVTIFIAILTTFNYLLMDIRVEKWMDRLKPEYMPYLAHFIMFSFIYYGIVFLCYRFNTIPKLFQDPSFITRSLFMLLVLTIDVSFQYHKVIIKELFEFRNQYYLHRVISQITSFFTMVLPLLFYYLKYEKHNDNFYGLQASARSIKQYFPLILLMIPLIAVASFDESFRNFYPRFPASSPFMDWPKELRAFVFEVLYALDFINTEFLFRGFMILAFTAYLGPRAILPMVGLYVALHYGKPLGETVGSFFGGYILGVLTYQSKNIWGGIVAHMGVALLMELAAWLQKVFN